MIIANVPFFRITLTLIHNRVHKADVVYYRLKNGEDGMTFSIRSIFDFELTNYTHYSVLSMNLIK